MDELKVCPFCGGEALDTKVNEIYCTDCDANVDAGVKFWNTRPIEDAQAKEIERLEARVKEIRTMLGESTAETKRNRVRWGKAKATAQRLKELICRAAPIMWVMTGDDLEAGKWEKEAEQALEEKTDETNQR